MPVVCSPAVNIGANGPAKVMVYGIGESLDATVIVVMEWSSQV